MKIEFEKAIQLDHLTKDELELVENILGRVD